MSYYTMENYEYDSCWSDAPNPQNIRVTIIAGNNTNPIETIGGNIFLETRLAPDKYCFSVDYGNGYYEDWVGENLTEDAVKYFRTFWKLSKPVELHGASVIKMYKSEEIRFIGSRHNFNFDYGKITSNNLLKNNSKSNDDP